MICLATWVGMGGLLVAGEGGFGERAANFLSRDLQETRERLLELEEELVGLPELRYGEHASRIGFHSGTVFGEREASWVQVDLGGGEWVDAVVLVPAQIATIDVAGEGYGFPLRFKVEVADDVGMAGGVVVVDESAADVENPGLYPKVLKIPKVFGRYVRVTALKHQSSNEEYFWAMEELMVLSGNRNVAMGCEVTATSQLELMPSWSLRYINDGFSNLGMPVSAELSLQKGYISEAFKDEMEEKWVMVDLGGEFPVDEVRLLPAGSERYLDGRGYPRAGERPLPRRMVVEVSRDAEFQDQFWRTEITSESMAYPFGCPVVVPSGGVTGRYVRVRALRHWAKAANVYMFAMSELQVYVGDENVALGKEVRVQDVVGRLKPTRWMPEYLVDGLTSRHPLIEMPEYLDLVVRRGVLEKERGALIERRDKKTEQIDTTVTIAGSGLGAGAFALCGWLLVRQKSSRRRDTERLREQIARDLHDEIGSNLGGIVLLSEMASRHGGIDAAVQGDLSAIKKAAEQSGESMQDIVWLIEPGRMGVRELVLRFRRVVELMLVGLEVTVAVSPSNYRDRELSLLVKRHFFLAFKEVLNNVRKHARAKRVEVEIEVGADFLSFVIRDDGVGFDRDELEGGGHGLKNLEHRSERLKGHCRIESSGGEGTSVFFKAPLK